MTPKLIAASAYPSSASSPFGSTPTKASRLHPLLAFVFAGLASTLATSTQAHYTIQTLAGTATEQRTGQTASGTNRLQSRSHTENPALPDPRASAVVWQRLITGAGKQPFLQTQFALKLVAASAF